MTFSGVQLFSSMAVVSVVALPMAPQPQKETPLSLTEVFRSEESPLLRYAFGLVGRREVAEDLVQDAFMRLHQNWDDVEQPRAWLFRCVRNRSYNYNRDHKREALTDPTTQEGLGDKGEAGPSRPGRMGQEASDEVLAKMEAAGILHVLMGELDERDQQLVRLRYFEEQKYDQISEAMGMSVGNVGYRLHHVLRELADSLRRSGVEGATG